MPFGISKTHSFPSFWITNSFLIVFPSSSFPTKLKVILSVSLFFIQTLSTTFEFVVGVKLDLFPFKKDNPFTIIYPPFKTLSISDWQYEFIELKQKIIIINLSLFIIFILKFH